jgi:hypothetical protein
MEEKREVKVEEEKEMEDKKNGSFVLCRLIHTMARNSSHHRNLLGTKSMLFCN